MPTVISWPTPTAGDPLITSSPTPGMGERYRARAGGNLLEAVADRMWPTPTANEDAVGRPGAAMQRMLGNHPDVRTPDGGTLNPTWVEWLMGFPPGWTDCEG